jgi:peptidoglycan L-alanyl-D-glutamate endopeptidase CwlK
MQYVTISKKDADMIIGILQSGAVHGPPSVAVKPVAPPPVTTDSGFVFGTASLNELKGVDKRLVDCCHLALKYSTQDFCVYDGIRTYKEQEQHVKNGTSQTMESKHLEGRAVDLVPWVESGPVWDWEKIYPIAAAMDKAATELGIANLITWGGVWDRKLSDLNGNYKAAVEDYVARRKAAGKSAFIDGPHFEILK